MSLQTTYEEAFLESERKYKDLADSLPLAVFETDIEGKITYANRVAFDLFGYTQDDFDQGLNSIQMLISKDHKRALDNIQRILKGETLGGKEYTAQRKNGHTFPVVIHSNCILSDGKPIGLRGIIIDLSKLKQAEASLKKSAILINSTTDAIISTDVKGNITLWNKGAERIYGYREDEVLGKSITMIYKEEDVPVLRSMIADLSEGKVIPSIEVTCIDKNRNEVPVLLSLTTIRNQDGKIIELIGITKEITELKQMEKNLRRERNKAEKLFDIAGVMFVAIDTRGDVVLLNQKGCKVLGYKQEEAIAKNWFDIFLPENIKEQTRLVFEKLIAGEVEPAEYYENPVVTKRGEERLIAWHNTVLRDDDNNIIGTLSSGEDITDRKRAEEALLEREARLRSILDSVKAGIIIIDPENHNIIEANTSAVEMIGDSKEKIIGSLCHEYICPSEIGKCPITDLDQEIDHSERGLPSMCYCL